MASAGAKANHVSHVSTQLPYALTVAAVSAVSYVIAGWLNRRPSAPEFARSAWFSLAIAVFLMLVTLVIIEKVTGREPSEKTPKESSENAAEQSARSE